MFKIKLVLTKQYLHAEICVKGKDRFMLLQVLGCEFIFLSTDILNVPVQNIKNCFGIKAKRDRKIAHTESPFKYLCWQRKIKMHVSTQGKWKFPPILLLEVEETIHGSVLLWDILNPALYHNKGMRDGISLLVFTSEVKTLYYSMQTIILPHVFFLWMPAVYSSCTYEFSFKYILT